MVLLRCFGGAIEDEKQGPVISILAGWKIVASMKSSKLALAVEKQKRTRFKSSKHDTRTAVTRKDRKKISCRLSKKGTMHMVSRMWRESGCVDAKGDPGPN